MGSMPEWRLIRKNETTKKWDNIGAAWNSDRGGFSVVIELQRGGEKIKCLMVENKPKPEAKPVQESSVNDEIPF